MTTFALALALSPLAAFVLSVCFARRSHPLAAGISIAGAGASFVLSCVILAGELVSPQRLGDSLQWLSIPQVGAFRGLELRMGVLVDPLSALMLFIVSLVALLVIVYSVGYMKGDRGVPRYFAYLSLFSFSMLGLVIADNYFQTYIFWELVGLSSYLLIGFWYEKPEAADASRKAFITNRWGDFGFMTGILLVYVAFGTFDFGQLSTAIQGAGSGGALTLMAALVFLGPMAKSAQFPLHVWLPDAMEGPTPVSALIHAATMVAAGVYLVARGFALFAGAPQVLEAMAYLGAFTALFAASIALVQRDIKRILAYSTLSQLGYMFLALGAGSMGAGMFHLTTHAFFKALLFLGAGCVIHALHEQDIFKMGGLAKKMPITAWTFVIGSLALSGIFPLAGFWSKDEILLTALSHGYPILFGVGLLTAFMTAFYMFRLIFTVFFGKEPEGSHAHEVGPFMSVPLIVLALLSVFAGLVGSPAFQSMTGGSFGSFIFFGEPEAPQLDLLVAGGSTLVALLGILLAWVIYGKKAIAHESLARTFAPIHKILSAKYYIDELYALLYDKVMLVAGRLFDWIDHRLIDGLFDGLGGATKAAGGKLRLLQSGRLQGYALAIFAAVAIAVIAASTNLLGGIGK